MRYPDVGLEPTGDFWTRPGGLAMLWSMSAAQVDESLGIEEDDVHGREFVGRRWTVEGMSYLVFDGHTVVREVDHHDFSARERSLRAG